MADKNSLEWTAPELSIVIPTHNRRDLLLRTLRSIFDERIEDLEIIVVDNGSTDSTGEALRELPVRYLWIPHPLRPAVARNIGLRESFGHYVTFIDSDDLVPPGGLTRRIEWLRRHPEAEAVGGQLAGFIDLDDRVIEQDRLWAKLPPRLTFDSFVRAKGVYRGASTYIFARTLLDRTGWFDERLRIVDDCDYLLRVLRLTDIDMLDTGVLSYRVHERNISREIQRGVIVNNRLCDAEMALLVLQYKLQSVAALRA